MSGFLSRTPASVVLRAAGGRGGGAPASGTGLSRVFVRFRLIRSSRGADTGADPLGSFGFGSTDAFRNRNLSCTRSACRSARGGHVGAPLPAAKGAQAGRRSMPGTGSGASALVRFASASGPQAGVAAMADSVSMRIQF